VNGAPGKVAVVTGASSGIGEAAARRLGDAGFTVYAVARRVDRMQSLADRGIHTMSTDVTRDDEMVALVDRVIAEAGRIDVLVNNAGYGSYGALEEVTLEEARRQVEVNLFGLARLTQLVVPHMRAQGGGHILNISSIGGKMGEPLGVWYHATKFAVEGLSDSLRPELAPFGIHVVVIEPGAIRTEWGAIAADHLESATADGPYEQQAATHARVLRSGSGEDGRGSDPDVVAKAIVKAATATRPRTRYAVGLGAKPIMALRKVLPDRAFDWVLATGYKAVDRATR
jgi:NAD(P)-dependent dehydrogenase (short-subunit alcohol dehydrogenase family)